MSEHYLYSINLSLNNNFYWEIFLILDGFIKLPLTNPFLRFIFEKLDSFLHSQGVCAFPQIWESRIPSVWIYRFYIVSPNWSLFLTDNQLTASACSSAVWPILPLCSPFYLNFSIHCVATIVPQWIKSKGKNKYKIQKTSAYNSESDLQKKIQKRSLSTSDITDCLSNVHS